MKHLSRRVVTSLCLGLFVGVQLFSALVAPHITAAATVYDRSADPAEHVKAYAYYFAMVRCAGDFKEYIPISQAGDVPNWLSPADRDVAVGYLIAPDDGRKECQHLFDAGIKMLGFASKQEFLKALGYKDYTCPASGNSDCTPNGKYLHLSGYSSDTRDTNIRNNMRDVLKKQAYNGESPVMRPYMEYVMYNATLKAACGLKFVQMASKGAPVKADGTAASGVHFAAVTQEGGRYGITDTYYSYDASDIGNSSGEKALYEASTGNKTISLDCGQMMLKMGADPKADPLKNPLALAYADYLNKLAVKDISKTVCGEAPAGEAAQSAYQACKAAVAKAFAECQESRMGAQATTLTTNAQVAACMLPKLQQYSPNLTQDSLAAALDGAAADIFDANASAVDVPGEDNVCGYQDGSALNWIACPITMAMQGAAKAFAEKLESLLYFPADKLFTPGSEANDGLRKAWGGFRNLGIGIIVIAGLVMVASQALGLELLDAYTIRKLMPRLLIALIGVALSWPLMNFLVSFFNDIGTFTYGLITQPFSSMPLINQGADTKAANVLLTIGGAGFLAYLYVIGFIASLSLLGSILLALFIAFFVLAIRWVAIAACIVLAPLAIASYVLPGTQKLWGFWKNTFLSTLIMFPILMALIASGDAMARIATALDGTNAFFIYIMYFAPFFLFSTAFKLAGGVIGGISQLANDKAGGVFSGLKNFRRNSAKRHWGSLADGSRGGRLAQKTIGTAARATTIPDQNLFTRTGRDRFRSASNKLLQDSARKRAEEDRGHSLGDTDETRAAIMANSRKDFLDTMMNKHGYSAKEARKKLARLEAGTRSPMGSNAMKASAMRGQTTLDGGGWWDKDKNQFDHAGYAKAAKHLMDIGVFREEDLGAMLAENAQRGDMNMGTFSERVNYNKLIKDGASIDEIAQRGNASMYRSIKSSQAMTANLRTAEQVSEQGIARIDAALSGDNSQIGTKNVGDGPVLLGGGGMDTVAAEYAQYGNYQEMMGYASSTNREAFAKQLLASPVGALSGEAKQALGDLQQYYAAQGKEMTHQDVLDALRGSGPLVSVGQVDAAGKPVYETTKNGKVKLDASGNPVQKMTTRSLVDSKYIQVYTARHRELSARAVAESGGKFMPNQNPGPPTPP